MSKGRVKNANCSYSPAPLLSSGPKVTRQTIVRDAVCDIRVRADDQTVIGDKVRTG